MEAMSCRVACSRTPPACACRTPQAERGRPAGELRERCWAAIGQLKGQKQGKEGGHSVTGVPPWLRKLCFKGGIEGVAETLQR